MNKLFGQAFISVETLLVFSYCLKVLKLYCVLSKPLSFLLEGLRRTLSSQKTSFSVLSWMKFLFVDLRVSFQRILLFQSFHHAHFFLVELQLLEQPDGELYDPNFGGFSDYHDGELSDLIDDEFDTPFDGEFSYRFHGH